MTIAASCRSNRRHQGEQATQCARQTGGDTGKNDDRNTVAQAALGDLLTQPHQEHGTGQQRHHRHEAECHARINHQARLRFQRDGNAERLEQRQRHREVPGVLGDLAAAGFAFFFQRFHLRRHDRHQLHDDRGRDVRHDTEGKHGKAWHGAAREHVEHAQDAAFILFEQRSQCTGSIPGTGT